MLAPLVFLIPRLILAFVPAIPGSFVILQLAQAAQGCVRLVTIVTQLIVTPVQHLRLLHQEPAPVMRIMAGNLQLVPVSLAMLLVLRAVTYRARVASRAKVPRNSAVLLLLRIATVWVSTILQMTPQIASLVMKPAQHARIPRTIIVVHVLI